MTKGNKKLKLSIKNNSFSKVAQGTYHSQKVLEASFSKNIPLKNVLFLSLFMSVSTIILVLLTLQYLPPEVPLLYGLPLGEDQIASSSSLIIPSLISIVVFVINSTITFILNDKYLQQLLVLTTFAVTLLSSITTLKIILLVSSF